MAKFMLISVILVLAAFIKEGSALKCWRCSSDLSDSAFCADPFNPMLILNERQRNWSYIDCKVPHNPYGTPPKALCKKIKETLNNREVVRRLCTFVDSDTPPNQCSTDSYVAYVKKEFCQTCSTDGCNGAEMESFAHVDVGSGAISIDHKIAILVNSFLFLLFIF